MSVERIPVTDRESWLKLRLHDLTASDIAGVAGVDPSKTPLRVYAEKTGRISGPDDNAIMRRGRWLEAAVIEALRDERPTWDVRRAGVYLRDPDIRMGATPDAVASDPSRPGIGNVQCKVVARPVFERDWGADGTEAPLKFQLQTLAEGMLIGSSWNAIAALVINTYTAELVIVEVPRHAEAEQHIRRIVVDFWRNVEKGIEPRPLYHDDYDVITALYPEVKRSAVDLSKDNLLPQLLSRRARRKALIKKAEEWIQGADAEIRHKIGDAEEGMIPGWKITLKQTTRKEHLVPASTFRTLRVTDRRAKEDAAHQNGDKAHG